MRVKQFNDNVNKYMACHKRVLDR